MCLVCAVTDRIFTFNPLEWKDNNYSEVDTLAVNGWAVTFGTARRGLGGLAAPTVSSSLYQM